MEQDTTQLIQHLTADLQQQADPAYRDLVRTRYNMNVDNFLGVRAATIHKIAGKHYKTFRHEEIDQRLARCDALLATGVYEHKIAAFRWAYLSRKDFAPSHLGVFAGWLDTHVDDWIDCDDLCVHVIGEFFLRYPEQAAEVIAWTGSGNLWTRRGAAVGIVLPARRGQQLPLVFQVSDRLMDDKEDLVQKAYGWLLKEASKTHPDEIFAFVMERRDTMPRVAFRYALEKLPESMRETAMGKPASA